MHPIFLPRGRSVATVPVTFVNAATWRELRETLDSPARAFVESTEVGFSASASVAVSALESLGEPSDLLKDLGDRSPDRHGGSRSRAGAAAPPQRDDGAGAANARDPPQPRLNRATVQPALYRLRECRRARQRAERLRC